jgi:hypothetical protein
MARMPLRELGSSAGFSVVGTHVKNGSMPAQQVMAQACLQQPFNCLDADLPFL